MDHQRAVTPSNTPASTSMILPPPPSSAGVPKHDHPQAELVRHGRQGNAGADRGRGDDVVAARVADLRQRVVLGEHRDVQRPGP